MNATGPAAGGTGLLTPSTAPMHDKGCTVTPSDSPHRRTLRQHPGRTAADTAEQLQGGLDDVSAAYRCRDPRLSGRFCSPYSSRGRGDDWPRRPRCAVRAGCVVKGLRSACWTLTDAEVTYGVRSRWSNGRCDGLWVGVRS